MWHLPGDGIKRDPERENLAVLTIAAQTANLIHIRVMFNAVAWYLFFGWGTISHHYPTCDFVSTCSARSSPPSSQPNSSPLSPAVPRRRICKTWLEVLIKGSKTPPSSFHDRERRAVDRRGPNDRDWNAPERPNSYASPRPSHSQVVFWFGLGVCSVARISGERLGAR